MHFIRSTDFKKEIRVVYLMTILKAGIPDGLARKRFSISQQVSKAFP